MVICTHINKDNVHNHIILNSVSFIDGYKYHDSKAQIAFLKETSDRLCLYYGLSIIDTPKANKHRRKNNMIFEELNFLARHSFNSVFDVTKYKENLSNKLPELKGKRELLWKKHKSADTNKKTEILKDINALTEEIDIIQAQKNACN